MEKIGERILIRPGDLHGRNFQKHLELLDQAAETVLAMVKELRKVTNAATAREMNSRLQAIEGDADKLELICCATSIRAVTARNRSSFCATFTSCWKR